MYTIHNLISPHRSPHLICLRKLWIQVDCCVANKQNNNTHTRTSQCKNNIVIVNCFRCNSHIILNAPILYANKKCAAFWYILSCVSFREYHFVCHSACYYMVQCSRCMQIVAFTDEIITLLPLYNIWRNIFSHTVCVTFYWCCRRWWRWCRWCWCYCCKCKWVHPEKPIANSQ